MKFSEGIKEEFERLYYNIRGVHFANVEPLWKFVLEKFVPKSEHEKSISEDNQTITKLYEAIGELKAEKELHEKFEKDLCAFFPDGLYDETPLELVGNLIEKNEKLGKEYVIAIDTWRAEVEKLQTENQKLQKDTNDLTKAYAKNIQFIMDVLNDIKSALNEWNVPSGVPKLKMCMLKEKILSYMKECCNE